ncbi:hypothetical protein BC827DRAFT_83230 [Russula dissimulans]|nr:hypothetical protein BC827DRAFT_83230 [Russula dissimulans]
MECSTVKMSRIFVQVALPWMKAHSNVVPWQVCSLGDCPWVSLYSQRASLTPSFYAPSGVSRDEMSYLKRDRCRCSVLPVVLRMSGGGFILECLCVRRGSLAPDFCCIAMKLTLVPSNAGVSVHVPPVPLYSAHDFRQTLWEMRVGGCEAVFYVVFHQGP